LLKNKNGYLPRRQASFLERFLMEKVWLGTYTRPFLGTCQDLAFKYSGDKHKKPGYLLGNPAILS